MNGWTLLAVAITAILAYFAGRFDGREEGYNNALEEIFGADAGACPHGYDWDECPDCCH